MGKGTEFKNLSIEDIQSQAKELEAKLFDMKFQSSLGKLENTSEIRTTRRELARAKTVIHEKRSGMPAKKTETAEV